MNAILERQSPDWKASDFDAVDSARLLAYRLHGDTPETEKYARYTGELFTLWEDCFSVSFASCRGFLKELAHDSWRKVKNCQAIFSESRHRTASETIFGQPGWLLFTDDDDWFAPDIFERVEAIAEQSICDCVLWNRLRFDGDITITPIKPTAEFPLYAYTNNYAIRSETFTVGSSVSAVMQHGFANTMVEKQQWRALFAEGSALSVTNKSPCSWNYLHQAKQSTDPKKSLRQSVEKYATSDVQLAPTLQWAATYIDSAQLFFQHVLAQRCR